MKIQLNLEKQCVETAIKRRHEAAMLQYFKKSGDKQVLASQLVLLEKALATFDFTVLRGQWPALAGGTRREVCLAWDDAGTPCLHLDDQRIVPPDEKAF